MKAGQLTGYRTVEVVDVPDPTFGSGEALVRINFISVCGSDMRYFSRALPENQYPLSPGQPNHECIGVIQDGGSGSFKKGDRVIVFPDNNDGLKQFLVAPAERMILIPDWGNLEEWLMCQHVGTVLYSCKRMGSVVGQNIVILGQGGIGLAFTRFLKQMGALKVIAVDYLDNRLDFAKTLGADVTVNCNDPKFLDAIKECTDGVGPDIVVEAAGTEESVNQGIAIAKRMGKLIHFGQMKDNVIQYDFATAFDKNLDCIFTASSRAGLMKWAVTQSVAMVEKGSLDLGPLVTHQLPFSDLQKAYDMFTDREDDSMKVVVST